MHFDQWKKSQLGISNAIKKSDIDSYKISDNFDPKTYDDSLPWFNYISINMNIIKK